MGRHKIITKIDTLLHRVPPVYLLAIYNALNKIVKEKDHERKNNSNVRKRGRRIFITIHL